MDQKAQKEKSRDAMNKCRYGVTHHDVCPCRKDGLTLTRELVEALKDAHDDDQHKFSYEHSWKDNKKWCDQCKLITRAEATL